MPLRQDRGADFMLNYAGPRMPVYTDGRQVGWSGTTPDGRTFFMNDAEASRLRGVQSDRSAFRRMYNGFRAAGIAIPAVAAAATAAPSMFGSAAGGGGAAGGAGWTMPGVTAPTFGAPAAAGAATSAIAPAAASAGRLATFGRMFSSPGAALLVNSGLSILGNRTQSRQAELARQDLLAHNREALALQVRQLEEESRNAALDREERIALNTEINRLRRMELEAAEEEREYRRNREDQREARLEPYRRVSTEAMNRLSSMWGLS